MKDLIIIGAGDFARETAWIAERMNQQNQQWNILGFVDDRKTGVIDGYPVLGPIDLLCERKEKTYVTCAIGTGSVRKKVWDRLRDCPDLEYATLIDPSVIIGKDTVVEDGVILCAGTVLAINTRIGFNSIINFNCTIGHDTVLEECCTVHPGSNISGRVRVGASSDVGTGVRIIQEKTIAPGTILGAGAVVNRDITDAGTYVGVPAKRIK